jgi:hypothetical protein
MDTYISAEGEMSKIIHIYKNESGTGIVSCQLFESSLSLCKVTQEF